MNKILSQRLLRFGIAMTLNWKTIADNGNIVDFGARDDVRIRIASGGNRIDFRVWQGRNHSQCLEATQYHGIRPARRGRMVFPW